MQNQLAQVFTLMRILQEHVEFSSTNNYQTRSDGRKPDVIRYRPKSTCRAKAREQELKNMWAQNRMTKRQTQAKYGF